MARLIGAGAMLCGFFFSLGVIAAATIMLFLIVLAYCMEEEHWIDYE